MLCVPDGILDENHEGEERMRHVTIKIEGRDLLRQHQHVSFVSFFQVSFHPLHADGRKNSIERRAAVRHFLLPLRDEHP